MKLKQGQVKFSRKPVLCFLAFILSLQSIFAQTDSTVTLDSITVTGYLGRQYLLNSPQTVSRLDSLRLAFGNAASLLPAFNTLAGVRMEERSPLSYRLSIRGSLIRSPFGIRNVKVYLNGSPLTDASGNTYLNFLAPGNIGSMEIYKGPDGSIFGANSGGVVSIRSAIHDTGMVKLSAGGGSFGLLQGDLGGSGMLGKQKLTWTASYLQSGGYRQHSAAKRYFFGLKDDWNYHPRAKLSATVFYSNIAYETPGALTLAQFKADPRLARPATQFTPGAVEQEAGIRAGMLYGSLQHSWKITSRIEQSISVFGNRVNLTNPFITNYETRDEGSHGLRTILRFAGSSSLPQWITEANFGAEWQRTNAGIINYDNNGGERGALQFNSNLQSTQFFYFIHLRARLASKLYAESSVSHNHYRVNWSAERASSKDFDKQLMPRFAINWLPLNGFSLRLIASRGYAVPNINELVYRGDVNDALEPESGWNYEAGIRLFSKDRRLSFDASFFHYRLQQAIVRRVDTSGLDFFVNAGGTRQNGLEAELEYRLKEKKEGSWGLTLGYSHTLSMFRYTDYYNDTANYSGNDLTGVPRNISVLFARASLPHSFLASVQYLYNSSLPLNDANSEFAEPYHLLQAEIGWVFYRLKRINLQLKFGVDNILNQTYSLGNDLNALGRRYYNAAPQRNYFLRFSLNYN